jgi:hypothetical protein
MLNDKIRERTSKLIVSQYAEREEPLGNDLARAKADFSMHNAFHSSHMQLALQRIIARELEIRAMLAWESIVRVFETLGSKVTDTLKDDLQKELFKYVDDQYSVLSKQLNKEISLIDKHSKRSLAEILKQIKNKHEVEIELYVDSLLERAKLGLQPSAPVYNYYAPVGIVQTGPYASAHIIQNLGSTDKEALLSALSMVRDTLDGIRDISEPHRKELTQIVEESVIEIQSRQPNNTKLESMLSTLAVTIQTIASAGQVYQTLKSALMPLGIAFP